MTSTRRAATPLIAVLALLASIFALVGPAGASPSTGSDDVAAAAGEDQGYWLVADDGGIFNFGTAGFHGSTGATVLAQPIVGVAATPSGDGYWLVAADGGIFSFGDAGFFGSTGATTLNQPIVGMAASPTGEGYWLVAADGGIFSFGDAGFFGSTGATTLNQPIVGMSASPTGKGYWFVAADGGIFGFGDAGFFGSTGDMTLNQPIVGMASTPTGKGYWFVAEDGGLFTFGDAGFFGSGAGTTIASPIVGIAASTTGLGYWLAEENGTVLKFGDAVLTGSAANLNRPVVGIASTSGALSATSPLVTDPPDDVTVAAGAPATFTADASGSPTPTVQWQVSSDSGTTFTNVVGATAETLSITGTTVGQSGNRYRAVFTNSAGTATSSAATLTVAPIPTLTGAAPNQGDPAGSGNVVLTGTGLTGATSVTFGAATATFTVDSATQITATLPAGTAGATTITVTTPGGTATTAFTYVTPAVSPSSGPAAGGTVVTITGPFAGDALSVSFGGVAGTSFSNTPTAITVTTPAHAAGAVDVTISTNTGPITIANAFTYIAAPALSIVAPNTFSVIEPDQGPVAGGTAVIITGSGFLGATAVNILDSVPSSTPATTFTVVDDTRINATMPAHAAGGVVIEVVAPGGTGASGGQVFTYNPLPVITSVAPSSGPTAGGTAVTITGTGLGSASNLTFDGVAGTSLVAVNDTTVTAVTPAHAAGAVNVVITTSGGTDTETNGFTYSDAPTITSISPTGTNFEGGNPITITGTNFTGATSVTFAGEPALFTVDSATQITATAVEDLGFVGNKPIVVTTPAGSSNAVNIGYS